MTTADQWSSILADIHRLRRSITERGGQMHVDLRIHGEAQPHYGIENDIDLYYGCIALRHDRHTTSYTPVDRIASITTRIVEPPKTGLKTDPDE